ncbi:osmoprotectant transport system substrate-binding protein [Alicyclobacillus hesperidum]|uniref:Osmoprotectant transport system substrate-binding protein n=1 Tax=Alicyclobacillus hesperidum TaxID=89784 RepID=A0A1H2UNX1_9BACL|nr:glycine betaine ABC transporter substrate-binding protein [Alicyclobacillus hesperidum]SDW57801.1 osmoprotectant transport system substrate-binding protein [Alicyclobacillus hesperidum]
MRRFGRYGRSLFRFFTGRRQLRTASYSVISLALIAAVTGCGTGGASNSNTIVIGGKNFTEQLIMANVLKLLIQHDDPKLHVVMKDNLDTNVLWNAMKNGDVDAYVEYTGTGLVNILHDKVTQDPNKAYDEVKQQFEQKYHVTWLKPIGFNDTYAMVMRASEAKRLGISTLSQLAAKSPSLTLGSEQNFVGRADGLPGLEKVYGAHFQSVKTMEVGLKYEALIDKKVDVVDGYSTDPEIPEYHLTVLQDNRHFFPPYYAVPIIRDSTLKAHPELRGILNKLAGTLDDSQMQQLNAEVDVDKKSPSEVAKDWLTAKGLI